MKVIYKKISSQPDNCCAEKVRIEFPESLVDKIFRAKNCVCNIGFDSVKISISSALLIDNNDKILPGCEKTNFALVVFPKHFCFYAFNGKDLPVESTNFCFEELLN